MIKSILPELKAGVTCRLFNFVKQSCCQGGQLRQGTKLNVAGKALFTCCDRASQRQKKHWLPYVHLSPQNSKGPGRWRPDRGILLTMEKPHTKGSCLLMDTQAEGREIEKG